jgi:uncharacterized membrane protein
MKRWHPLEKVLLGAFLFWSGAGLIFTLGRISPDTVAAWGLPSWLAAFIDGCLKTGDPILLILAFANTHLHAARQWTPPLARRWALIVLVAALAIETLGTLTGFPFGAYHYTNRFGPLIGVVPLTIPLAWHVVVTNALFLVRAGMRNSSRLVETGLTGLACTLYDFILEPFATGAKRYWVWDAGTVPAQNYIAWFVLSGLLVWIFAPTASTRFPRDPRPAILLAMTLLIFLAGRWA